MNDANEQFTRHLSDWERQTIAFAMSVRAVDAGTP